MSLSVNGTLDTTPCYNENGGETGDIACGFSSSNQCCGSGWDCLENGLCQQHGTTSFSQGSCTDLNYDLCLSFCNKSEYDGATEVSSCGINSWCCAGEAGLTNGPDCCDSSNSTTSLFPFPYATIAADDVGLTTVTDTLTSSTSATLASALTILDSGSGTVTSAGATIVEETSVMSSSPSSTSSGPTSSTSSVPTGSISSSTITSTTISSTAAAATFSPINNELSTGAKAGIGAAVPLVLILIGALAFFFWKSRKQEKYLKTLQQGRDPEPDAPIEGYVMGNVEHKAFASELGDSRIYKAPELDSTVRHELASPQMHGWSHEIQGQPRYELR